VNDGSLLVFGCVVSFLAVAGAYVFLRFQYLDAETSGVERIEDRASEPASRPLPPTERG
jgi:hypothetical protein